MERRKSKLFILFILIFLIGLSACRSKNTFSDNLVNYLNNECVFAPGVDTCIINLKDITDFDWDKMYIYGGYSRPESISDDIGFQYLGKYVKDDTFLTLFIRENEIVYEERRPLNSKTQYYFIRYGIQTTKPYFDEPYNVCREIRKDGGYFYILRPVSDKRETE